MENPLNFPQQKDKYRLQQYEYFDNLYYGNHFEAFMIRAEDGFSQQYAKLRYVVANFPGLISRVMADMLFGENVVFNFEDENIQQYADKLIERNGLVTQLYESAIVASRKGDAVFKVRIGKRNPLDDQAPDEVIIEEINPAFYFPVFDKEGTRYTPVKDQIITKFEVNEKTYLHKEIHQPRKIIHEVYLYNPQEEKIEAEVNPEQFGFKSEEDTGVDRSLIFHIPNVRDGGGFWGSSDYRDLDKLFFALNNRITKIDNILDKHSDPILAVPPGVIDDEGNVRKEALGMFEVANDSTGFDTPEYIVWNANLEAAFNEIDKLVDMLFMFSEVSPTTLGMDKGGSVESGRALKFRLLATIRKRTRKMRYFEHAMEAIMETALQLATDNNLAIEDVSPAGSERPTVIWGDGVINDDVELVEIAQMRLDAGLSSRADEIAKLDGISPDDAKTKVEEIETENTPDLPTPPVQQVNPIDDQEG